MTQQQALDAAGVLAYEARTGGLTCTEPERWKGGAVFYTTTSDGLAFMVDVTSVDPSRVALRTAQTARIAALNAQRDDGLVDAARAHRRFAGLDHDPAAHKQEDAS